jgi:predicted nucleic acid-binding protein
VAANDPFSVVVCDAGPLIHLDELKCLDLLNDAGEILVPEVVWQEVLRHRPSALRHRRVQLTRVEAIPLPSSELEAEVASLALDAGEQAALCLMERLPNAVLLTDDDAARTVARKMNFAVRGTIGVLLTAPERRRRSKRQLLNLLRRIPNRSTLWISRKLLNSIIAKVIEGTL